MTADVTVTVSGGLFQAHPDGVIDAFLDAATRDVAQQAYANVMTNLNRSIQHPTPYYETQIVVDQARASLVVHDRGIVYGPWLEGVSRRNAATRFKGYASFRRAFQTTRRDAMRLVDRQLALFLRRLS